MYSGGIYICLYPALIFLTDIAMGSEVRLVLIVEYAIFWRSRGVRLEKDVYCYIALLIQGKIAADRIVVVIGEIQPDCLPALLHTSMIHYGIIAGLTG